MGGDAIGAIWRLFRHYLNLSEIHTYLPKRKEVNKERNQAQTRRVRSPGRSIFESSACNSSALEWRKPILEKVMEALADPNTHLIGIYGKNDHIKHTLVDKVDRRIQRDRQFDMVLTTTVTKKPDVKKIQDELARQLGLTLNRKVKLDIRANELSNRIKKEQTILIILRDLYKELDLGKLGVPYGVDHKGCKILLTSTTGDVLPYHLNTEKSIMV